LTNTSSEESLRSCVLRNVDYEMVKIGKKEGYRKAGEEFRLVFRLKRELLFLIKMGS